MAKDMPRQTPAQTKIAERRYTTQSGAVYTCISSPGAPETWSRSYKGKSMDLNDAAYVSEDRATEFLVMGGGRTNPSDLLKIIRTAKADGFKQPGGIIISIHGGNKLRPSKEITKINPGFDNGNAEKHIDSDVIEIEDEKPRIKK